MHDFEDTLAKLFTSPFCPNCATVYSHDQYDLTDDCACCSNCGTPYDLPDEYHPDRPEESLEQGFIETPQLVELAQFRTDVQRVADGALRETAGASYELYERRFTEACEVYLDDLDPEVRPYAVAIAKKQGYVENMGPFRGFGPGLCPMTGLDEGYCHCGGHP